MSKLCFLFTNGFGTATQRVGVEVSLSIDTARPLPSTGKGAVRFGLVAQFYKGLKKQEHVDFLD